ncbi:hypothetical protein FRC03_010139 [Tulasnella sp. 419]|nr:hypothetical protein FRC03_010139 [Tulasnella sp. 419]
MFSIITATAIYTIPFLLFFLYIFYNKLQTVFKYHIKFYFWRQEKKREALTLELIQIKRDILALAKENQKVLEKLGNIYDCSRSTFCSVKDLEHFMDKAEEREVERLLEIKYQQQEQYDMLCDRIRTVRDHANFKYDQLMEHVNGLAMYQGNTARLVQADGILMQDNFVRMHNHVNDTQMFLSDLHRQQMEQFADHRGFLFSNRAMLTNITEWTRPDPPPQSPPFIPPGINPQDTITPYDHFDDPTPSPPVIQPSLPVEAPSPLNEWEEQALQDLGNVVGEVAGPRVLRRFFEEFTAEDFM